MIAEAHHQRSLADTGPRPAEATAAALGANTITARAEALFKKVFESKDASPALKESAEGRLALLSFIKSRGRGTDALFAYFEKKKETASVVDHARMLMQAYQDGDDVAKMVAVGEYLVKQVGEGDATLLNNYAWFLATHDAKLDRALELARKAAALEPEAAFILDTLGECLFRKGQLKEAVETQRKALKLAPERQREEMAERLNKFEKALENRKKAAKKKERTT